MRCNSLPEKSSSFADFLSSSRHVVAEAEGFLKHVIQVGWHVVHHHTLPDWLKDNEYLIAGHRRPLHSFKACFKSVFRIHTETGNIWTHLIGNKLVSSWSPKTFLILEPFAQEVKLNPRSLKTSDQELS